MIVVWRVTEKCNLACPFCAYDKTLVRSRREADPRQIEQFLPVLADLRQRRGGRVLVSWLGGEPMLYAPLPRLTERAHALGLAVSVTTNGTTLGAQSVRDHVLEHYAELTVSVDAIGTKHDDLRGWRGGYASLEKGVRELARAKRERGKGPLLRANVVLMRETIADLEELCHELGRWGVEEVTFNQLGGIDRPEYWPDHRLAEAQVTELARQITDLRARLEMEGVRVRGGSAYFERMLATARGVKMPVADCGSGREFLFVDELGRVAPCSFTVESLGQELGSVRGVEELEGLGERFAAGRRGREVGACGDCRSTWVGGKFD